MFIGIAAQCGEGPIETLAAGGNPGCSGPNDGRRNFFPEFYRRVAGRHADDLQENLLFEMV